MRISNDDRNAIRQAIHDTLSAHIKAPFHTLREAGMQADLRTHLQSRLNPSTVSVAQPVKQQQHRSFAWPQEHTNTSRVALEMKIRTSPFAPSKVTDIAILQDQGPVTLQWGNGGPGDALSQISSEQIIAAIEIKASPATSAEKNLYMKDINKLINLSKAGIAGFFVLANKSLGLYGERLQKTSKHSNWLNFEKISAGLKIHTNVTLINKSKVPILVEIWEIVFNEEEWIPEFKSITQ